MHCIRVSVAYSLSLCLCILSHVRISPPPTTSPSYVVVVSMLGGRGERSSGENSYYNNINKITNITSSNKDSNKEYSKR